MIFISHRGNLNSINKERENSPDYISEALSVGFDVEVDVWFENGKYYLGHDEPIYEVDVEFLQNEKIWCHAKNIEALIHMMNLNIHCFWHDKDKVTLTSKKYMWAHPSNQYPTFSIAVLPELEDCDLTNCVGICSDYIIKFKQIYDKTYNI